MKKLKIPLAFKLISITVLLLAGTTAWIAMRSAARFEEISVDQQEQSSRDQSRARATEVEGLLVSYVDKARVVASLLMKDTGTAEEKQKALDLTFGRDADLVAVEVIAKTPQAAPMRPCIRPWSAAACWKASKASPQPCCASRPSCASSRGSPTPGNSASRSRARR